MEKTTPRVEAARAHFPLRHNPLMRCEEMDCSIAADWGAVCQDPDHGQVCFVVLCLQHRLMVRYTDFVIQTWLRSKCVSKITPSNQWVLTWFVVRS